MTRRILIQNFKGGVGKTTTTVHLAHGLSLRGKRVLLIDLDHQANATKSLGIKVQEGQPVFYHIVVADMPYQDVAVEARPNLFVVPSNRLTSLAESQMNSAIGREMILSSKLGMLPEFDYVLIDSGAELNVLHNNALLFANEILIPISMEAFAVDAAVDILKSADDMSKVYGRKPSVCGVLPWNVDRRTNMTHTVVALLGQAYRDKVLPQIRSDETFKKASVAGQTIFEYDPRRKGAEDYFRVVDALLAQESVEVEPIVEEKGVAEDVGERIFATA